MAPRLFWKTQLTFHTSTHLVVGMNHGVGSMIYTVLISFPLSTPPRLQALHNVKCKSHVLSFLFLLLAGMSYVNTRNANTCITGMASLGSLVHLLE